MTLEIHNRGQGSLMTEEIRRAEFDRSWPVFMQQSPMGQFFYGDLAPVAEYQLVAIDGDETVAAAYSMPFALGTKGREELPDMGWDQVIRWGHADRAGTRERNAATALEICLPGA